MMSIDGESSVSIGIAPLSPKDRIKSKVKMSLSESLGNCLKISDTISSSTGAPKMTITTKANNALATLSKS